MITSVDTIEILVNGTPRGVPVDATLRDLLQSLGYDPQNVRGVAVAVNDEVVRRQDWADVVLGADVRVEIVTAKQGG